MSSGIRHRLMCRRRTIRCCAEGWLHVGAAGCGPVAAVRLWLAWLCGREAVRLRHSAAQPHKPRLGTSQTGANRWFGLRRITNSPIYGRFRGLENTRWLIYGTWNAICRVRTAELQRSYLRYVGLRAIYKPPSAIVTSESAIYKPSGHHEGSLSFHGKRRGGFERP